MRQPLKKLHEIFEPDSRSEAFSRMDGAGLRHQTIDDHYADITAIELSGGVPEAIRDEFDTIRNLYLYSWYVYDFTVPATLYSYALIEKAIKLKCASSSVSAKRHQGFRKLLMLSIREGWLTNVAFQSVLDWEEEEFDPSPDDSFLPTHRSFPRYDPSGTDYCERLAKTLPELRNIQVHGEGGLSIPASTLGMIETCACIVNGLFPDPGSTLAEDPRAGAAREDG